MTIIEPNRGQRLTKALYWCGVALIGVAMWSIVSYNETVTLARNLKSANAQHEAAVVRNTELRDERYAITDAAQLKLIAQSRGLVSVKKPKYIELEKNIVVANK